MRYIVAIDLPHAVSKEKRFILGSYPKEGAVEAKELFNYHHKQRLNASYPYSLNLFKVDIEKGKTTNVMQLKTVTHAPLGVGATLAERLAK